MRTFRFVWAAVLAAGIGLVGWLAYLRHAHPSLAPYER